MENFFASCPRGLEALLVDDLVAAGITHTKEIAGGVHFATDFGFCYAANFHSRIATRILWRVAKAPYAKEDDIYKLAYEQNWGAIFDVNKSLRVDVTAIKSPLRSLEFITLRIKDAVCDRFRADFNKRPNVDTKEPDIRIHAFLTVDECTLYLDTSGAPLYQRGLRQKTVEAPLKENLAAGVLRLSGWIPGTPLIDPMCGSGTFLLEAAQMAHEIAPGLGRNFGFEAYKNFAPEALKKLRKKALDAQKPITKSLIFGRDISPVAMRASLANLDRAGLLDAVNLEAGDFLDKNAPAESGILVANPPYGERLLETDELTLLYPKIGAALKAFYAGWTAHFLTADLRMPKLMRLQPSRKTPLFNGALECRLFAFKMVAGSNRKND